MCFCFKVAEIGLAVKELDERDLQKRNAAKRARVAEVYASQRSKQQEQLRQYLAARKKQKQDQKQIEDTDRQNSIEAHRQTKEGRELQSQGYRI